MNLSAPQTSHKEILYRQCIGAGTCKRSFVGFDGGLSCLRYRVAGQKKGFEMYEIVLDEFSTVVHIVML